MRSCWRDTSPWAVKRFAVGTGVAIRRWGMGVASRMSDSIFLIGADGSLTEAPSAAYYAEAELQQLLATNPDLLPGGQIDRDNPRRWLLIKREAGIWTIRAAQDGGRSTILSSTRTRCRRLCR